MGNQVAGERPALGVYNAKEMEGRLYDWWLTKGFFKAGNDKTKKPYSIVMPPPNVTGVLHIGHALDNAMQDLLIRMKRMQGFDALWMPGMDHAGIATQTRVESQLLKTEGKTRHDLGREAFVKRVWDWKEEYATTIRQQLKRLGASCDFSRERFTMDEGLSKAVREVFVRFYEKGLIYRGNYIIHWCPRCETALSDIEVEHEDTNGALYHIAYPFSDGTGALTIATTRPETMFGDVAVAVHPDDERYQHFIGKKLILPFIHREIPVIADEYVEKEFGTGAVKITPAHDPNDFEVGLRHHLKAINVMTKTGTLNDEAGQFAGMDRFAARKKIEEELSALGILHKESHTHAVGHCERCGTVIEPWLSTQWFVKMEPLAIPAQKAVDQGEVSFVPDRFSKIYTHWLDNIKDWCISRQLWWGHRIPAFYCDDCHEVIVEREDPHVCRACGSTHLHQDEDVLDTWFSSALWPFSTMGWPDETDDLQRYFPTQVLVTGFDIIYFWVARMIFTSLAFTEKAPFRHVLMHGLLRDAQGRKLSKSLGNGIDPMEVIDQYSADALRFMLVTGATLGQDMRFYTERMESAQGLVTKIWNAARFVTMNTTDVQKMQAPQREQLDVVDRYILHRLDETIEVATSQLEAFDFAEAGKTIYEFFWNDFCDWYIETSKVHLYGKNEAKKASTKETLVFVLDQALRLLHPMMPFVTEEIWQALPTFGETIMKAEFPHLDGAWIDRDAMASMNLLMDIIRAVRTLRHDANLPLSKPVPIILKVSDERLAMVKSTAPYIERLCNPLSLVIETQPNVPQDRLVTVLTDVEVMLSMEGLIDKAAEHERLQKEKQNFDFEVMRLIKKLQNASFVERAPDEVVQKEREKLRDYEEKRDKVIAMLDSLSK